MPKFRDFLNRNSVASIEGILPLVHSTKSYNIEDLVNSKSISPSFCKRYQEDLLYFFYGRPSYKYNKKEDTSELWELPTCFIFDTIGQKAPQRTIPFDSGAYIDKRYPSYLQSIPITEFECDQQDAPQRIISAVFGSLESYIRGQPKSETALKSEFQLGPLDPEVLAIRKLADDDTPTDFDDRRMAIEIHLNESVDFSITPPSAVILPTAYLKEPKIRTALESWGAEPLNYDTYSLSMDLYYGIIFDKFIQYCKDKGFIS